MEQHTTLILLLFAQLATTHSIWMQDINSGKLTNSLLFSIILKLKCDAESIIYLQLIMQRVTRSLTTFCALRKGYGTKDYNFLLSMKFDFEPTMLRISEL